MDSQPNGYTATNRMIHSSYRVAQAGSDIVGFRIGIVCEDLLPRFTRCQQLENVNHAHALTANAQPAAALFGVDRNAREMSSEIAGTSAKSLAKDGRGRALRPTMACLLGR